MHNIEMLWIVITAALLGVAWLWRREMRPYPNRIESADEVAGALQFLIRRGIVRRGIDGGSVRFEVDTDRSKSVRFVKYMVAHGDVGFRGHCAQGSCSDQQFTAFCQDLRERGIPHTVVSNGEKAVEMECHRDVGLGVMLVVLAFQRLFELKLGEHCVALFERVLVSDKPSWTGVDIDS